MLVSKEDKVEEEKLPELDSDKAQVADLAGKITSPKKVKMARLAVKKKAPLKLPALTKQKF